MQKHCGPINTHIHIYLLSKSPIAGGAFLGLAALTRFPTGIFFGIAFLCFLGFKKRKEVISLVKGFFIPVVPFLIFNYFMYAVLRKQKKHPYRCE